MARRTMTIKRVDPWSVLKVGFLANLVLLGILLLAGRVVWFFIERLELVTKACDVAGSVGFTDCGLNGGNIFRNAMLLGLLGVVVQTGILVFAAFLFNLISELTGGLTLGVDDDLPAVRTGAPAQSGRTQGRTNQPGEMVTARTGGPAPETVTAAGGMVGRVAQAAQKAAGAATAAASTATDAAKQAAQKAAAARADAEEGARTPQTPAPNAPGQATPGQTAQPRPEAPSQGGGQPGGGQPGGGQPTQVQRPAQPGPTPSAPSRPSQDLFGQREDRPGQG